MKQEMEKKFEKIVDIPSGVDIYVESRTIRVKGPKGEIRKKFDDLRFNHLVSFEKNGNSVVVKTSAEKKKARALVGTIASHTANMIKGVTKGYKYTMKIVTSHFPLNIEVKDSKVRIKNFLGEKGARVSDIRGDCKVKTSKESIEVEGINLEDVSQTAANIENTCRISGKDKRIFIDGIYIEGKFTGEGEKI
jgi:large subunit ribosomal protein L6